MEGKWPLLQETLGAGLENRSAIVGILHAPKQPVLQSQRNSLESSLVKRRLRPRSFLPKALNDPLDSSDVKLFLPEFVRSDGAEFFTVTAEAVLLELVRERIR